MALLTISGISCTGKSSLTKAFARLPAVAQKYTIVRCADIVRDILLESGFTSFDEMCLVGTSGKKCNTINTLIEQRISKFLSLHENVIVEGYVSRWIVSSMTPKVLQSRPAYSILMECEEHIRMYRLLQCRRMINQSIWGEVSFEKEQERLRTIAYRYNVVNPYLLYRRCHYDTYYDTSSPTHSGIIAKDILSRFNLLD